MYSEGFLQYIVITIFQFFQNYSMKCFCSIFIKTITCACNQGVLYYWRGTDHKKRFPNSINKLARCVSVLRGSYLFISMKYSIK